MRTSLDLCFCLLTLCGITPVLHGVKVFVGEDSDAVLPCLISTKEDLTGEIFFWKKDDLKEVFIYDNGLTGQDQQFKGRVSHFQDQLMNGNASIKIQNTKVANSGNYSCIFPRVQPRQTFIIELVVGASPKPYVSTLDKTKDWSLLQCEVEGASPEPKVEWQDRFGIILPAEEPQVSERGGRYNVTLKTTVTKTDHYRCVATQEEISHQTSAETFVQFNEEQSREVKDLRVTAIVLGAVLPLVVAVMCLYYLVRNNHLIVQIKKSDSHPRITHPPDDPDNISTDEMTPLAAEDQGPEVTDSITPPPDMKPDNEFREPS